MTANGLNDGIAISKTALCPFFVWSLCFFDAMPHLKVSSCLFVLDTALCAYQNHNSLLTTMAATNAGNVQSSIAARQWTSKHVIARLKRECESRHIPVTGKSLKRQDYLDKLNQYDANQSNQTPRDWTKLQKPDLQEECKFLGISLDGVRTKGEIVKKLEAHGSSQSAQTSQTQSNGQPTGQQAPDGAASTSQQQGAATAAAASTIQTSQWANLSYWDLFKQCKALGIAQGIRKKDLLLKALKDFDAAQNGQAALGASGIAASNGATNAAAASTGAAAAATAGANGPLPSPTVSQIMDGDFNRPLPMSTLTRAAATFYERDELGKVFPTGGWHCYRNSALIMLLHCNRLMSWIENAHLPTLARAGIAIKTELSKFFGDSDSDTSDSNDDIPKYTDIWCELFEFSEFYFNKNPAPSDADIEKAMEVFWEYLTADERDDELEIQEGLYRLSWEFRETEDHQDVPEFLLWLLSVAMVQPGYFFKREEEQRTEDRLVLSYPLFPPRYSCRIC